MVQHLKGVNKDSLLLRAGLSAKVSHLKGMDRHSLLLSVGFRGVFNI